MKLNFITINFLFNTKNKNFKKFQQPKELFKIRQKQIGYHTKGIITLIGELDFETQSMYTLKMYATVSLIYSIEKYFIVRP